MPETFFTIWFNLFIKNKVKKKQKILIDPHTATAFKAAELNSSDEEMLILSTAHPCKFPEAINKVIGFKADLPNELNYIVNAKENYEILPNNLDKIKSHILRKI